jgi:predicted enzyme related to lactoylglutathione lyase
VSGVTENRLVAVVIEVTDLERSAALYRDGFGVPLKEPDDHAGDDRWISGRHCATSWTDGAFLHFALYEKKTEAVTTAAQLGIAVVDLDAARERALAAGAQEIHGPKQQPWGRSARYRDFDGNVIELTQRT